MVNFHFILPSLYHWLTSSFIHGAPIFFISRVALPIDSVGADMAGRWSWEDARVYIKNAWSNFRTGLAGSTSRDDLGPKIYDYNWDDRSGIAFPITSSIGNLNERMKYDVQTTLSTVSNGMWDARAFPQLQKSFGYLVHSARGGTATFSVNQYVTQGDYQNARITDVPTVYIMSKDLVRGTHPALTALGYGYRYFTEFVWNGQKMDGNFVGAGLFQMSCQVITSSGASQLSICIHRQVPNV